MFLIMNSQDKNSDWRRSGSGDLERGFTTGSAAAAAAKAATIMLLEGKKVESVRIDTPADIELDLSIADCRHEKGEVEALVKKDAGDDPDVTDGLLIGARVERNPQSKGLKITGGRGVGKVTKPGLAVSPGEPAINPVPLEMIKKEVKRAAAGISDSGGREIENDGSSGSHDPGLRVTVFVPRGEEVAEKTFNPRLGIEGGISILGTTGIVEPMSDKAYKDSLALKLSQIAAGGYSRIVLVFGNRGKNRAKKAGFSPKRTVRMSNYVGFMLEKCCQEEIEEALLLGTPGKLVKVAAGIFNTHSSVADGRLETLAAYSAAAGGSSELADKILRTSTAEQAVKIIQDEGPGERVFFTLMEKVVERASQRIECDLKLAAALFSAEKGFLAAAGEGELLRRLKENGR